MSTEKEINGVFNMPSVYTYYLEKAPKVNLNKGPGRSLRNKDGTATMGKSEGYKRSCGNKEVLFVRVPEDIRKFIEHVCKITGLSKSVAVETIIRKAQEKIIYLSEKKRKVPKRRKRRKKKKYAGYKRKSLQSSFGS